MGEVWGGVVRWGHRKVESEVDGVSVGGKEEIEEEEEKGWVGTRGEVGRGGGDHF